MDTPRHAAERDGAAARVEDADIGLELVCVRRAIEAWATRGVAGKLFIDLSSSALPAVVAERWLEQMLALMRALGVAPASGRRRADRT